MRADKFFAEKFGSRTKAAQALEAGLVLADGKPIKANEEIKEGRTYEFLQENLRYVSNGGYKLERALENFPIFPCGKVFVDIGASTGGFSDCLLQNGAKKVYAVDVGSSQLCDKLRDDPRVVVMENTNARYVAREDFAEEIDGIVTDVSFISLKLIFPVIAKLLKKEGEAVVLIKPQFECENQHIGKSGIVSNAAHPKIVEKVLQAAASCELYPFGIVNAPVRKGKNIEYVVYLKKEGQGALSIERLIETVKELLKKNSEGLLK